MKKKQVVETIRKTKIIPVIRTRSADKARTIIEALVKGGIDVLEVTMTVPGAIRLIAELANQYKDAAIIGAGTVLDKDTAQKCIKAGAEFIVSPILNLETVSFCNQNEITVMAGALTPTEIYTANKAGADLVKVFPVSAMGGDSYIKAVKTVFPHVEIVPTGGVKLENAVDYIEAGALAIGMGGELTNEKESIITNCARNLLNQIKQKYQ